jgi:hypothetical protein
MPEPCFIMRAAYTLPYICPMSLYTLHSLNARSLTCASPEESPSTSCGEDAVRPHRNTHTHTHTPAPLGPSRYWTLRQWRDVATLPRMGEAEQTQGLARGARRWQPCPMMRTGAEGRPSSPASHTHTHTHTRGPVMDILGRGCYQLFVAAAAPRCARRRAHLGLKPSCGPTGVGEDFILLSCKPLLYNAVIMLCVLTITPSTCCSPAQPLRIPPPISSRAPSPRTYGSSRRRQGKLESLTTTTSAGCDAVGRPLRHLVAFSPTITLLQPQLQTSLPDRIPHTHTHTHTPWSCTRP